MAWIAVKNNLRALTRDTVARALILSLLAHLLIFSALEIALRTGLLEGNSITEWMRTKSSEPKIALGAQLLKSNEKPPEREIPLLFIDVDPLSASPEEPKNAKFYSANNTHAANPDASKNLNVPKIDGTQTHVPKTRDVPPDRYKPLQPITPPTPSTQEKSPTPTPAQPNPPEPQPAPELTHQPEPPQPARPPTGGPGIGDLALAKPSKVPQPKPGETQETHETQPKPQPHVRPRTLAAYNQLQDPGGLAGQKMKQDGGVRRLDLQPDFDVKATAFGAYDAMLIAAIQKRWEDIIKSTNLANRTGKVVLNFRLKFDGSVSAFKMEDYDVGEVQALMCQRAISDPAPFGPWTSEMRRTFGTDYREVRITFFYN